MSLNTNKLSLFIPFYYFYNTRLGGGGKFISWLMVYFLSQIIFVYCSGIDFFYYSFRLFLIVVSCYSVYELGYIYNDVFTVKKENEPTLRVSYILAKYIEENINKIFLYRCMISFFVGFISLGYLLFPYFIFLLSIFYLYNNTRSRINLILHFFLVFLRFVMPVFFVCGPDVLLLATLAFPCINLIERCTEKRFKFVVLFKLREHIHLYRVFYYSFCLLYVVFYTDSKYLYVFVYMFVIRLVFYLSSRYREKINVIA